MSQTVAPAPKTLHFLDMISLTPEISLPVSVESKASLVDKPTRSWESETHAPLPTPSINAGLFDAKVHHRVAEVAAEVDAYFLAHWPFQNERARQKFVAAGFSLVTCYYFPAAKDDRIAFACRLLTLLFLIDGQYFRQRPCGISKVR